MKNFENYYDETTRILSGPELKPINKRQCSMGMLVFEELRRRPNHICQIYVPDDAHLTNKELLLQAIRVARFFQSLGLSQDDIIGFSARNTTYTACVPVACFLSGIACHAVSPNHDTGTLTKLFGITQPKVTFCDGQDIEKITFATKEFETKIFTISNHVKGIPTILDLLKPTGDEDLFVPAELKYGPDQNMFLFCTSGTTGTPKIVTSPNSMQIQQIFNFGAAGKIQFVNRTIDWSIGLSSLLCSLLHGTTNIISDEPFTPEYFADVVLKYKVTLAYQTPPLANMFIKYPHEIVEKLDSIRYFVIAGSYSSTSLLNGIQKLLRFGQIVNIYGCSELQVAVTRNCFTEKKYDSIGRVLPGYRLRIVNDYGENLKRGEIGEMYFAGTGFWGGYYKNPEATREVYDEEGWLRTGDLAYIDERNYIYFVGRKKELLKYKSMHYYPKDIEDVIAEMPAVKEVCVFGIEDELVGEKAAAAVVKVNGTSLTEQDVVEYVRQKIDAEHKQLHGGCKFLKEIPRTTNYKYDRLSTKEMFSMQ